MIIIGIFVLVAGVIIYAISAAYKQDSTIISAPAVTRTTVNGFTMGDPNAKVVVEDFSDFNCVHCADFFKNIEPTIIEKYVNTGKVLFKYTPMSFISEYSGLATQAVFCADEQNKFWDLHDLLFANYGRAFTNGFLSNAAAKLGMDQKAFDACLSSGKYASKVDELNSYASRSGITSTPSFLVNGVKADQGTILQVIETQLNLGN